MAFIAYNWENDLTQFARVLTGIAATQDLDLHSLLSEMEMRFPDLEELFDRANQVWENAKVASDRAVSADADVQLVEMDVMLPVALVQRGMNIDLEDDPVFAECREDECSCRELWKYEHGKVADVVWETTGCIRLDFDNGESIGFAPEHMVKVHGKA